MTSAHSVYMPFDTLARVCTDAITRQASLCAAMREKESTRQFGAPLREQLDLQSEARNLARFNANFSRSKRVSFPKPIFPLVAPDVLVRCCLQIQSAPAAHGQTPSAH